MQQKTFVPNMIFFSDYSYVVYKLQVGFITNLKTKYSKINTLHSLSENKTRLNTITFWRETLYFLDADFHELKLTEGT